MGNSRYSVSFRVWHPSMDPNDITTNIGLEPHRAWKEGEPRTTPVGRPLEGVNRETYWSAKLCQGKMPPSALADDLDKALDTLSAHHAFLRQVRADGGRCEIFVGWHLRSQAGETLHYTVLAKLAALGIDLSLDNYYDPELPNDEM
jgi:hypothetical protein